MIKVTLIGTGRLSFNLMNEVLNNKISEILKLISARFLESDFGNKKFCIRLYILTFGAMQRIANLVDLEKCCKMRIWMLKSASI